MTTSYIGIRLDLTSCTSFPLRVCGRVGGWKWRTAGPADSSLSGSSPSRSAVQGPRSRRGLPHDRYRGSRGRSSAVWPSGEERHRCSGVHASLVARLNATEYPVRMSRRRPWAVMILRSLVVVRHFWPCFSAMSFGIGRLNFDVLPDTRTNIPSPFTCTTSECVFFDAVQTHRIARA